MVVIKEEMSKILQESEYFSEAVKRIFALSGQESNPTLLSLCEAAAEQHLQELGWYHYGNMIVRAKKDAIPIDVPLTAVKTGRFIHFQDTFGNNKKVVIKGVKKFKDHLVLTDADDVTHSVFFRY